MIGELYLDHAAGYRIDGNPLVALHLAPAAGGASRLSVTNGVHEIAARLVLSPTTVIDIAGGGAGVGGGATLKLSGGVRGKVAGINIAAGGRLDLTDNTLIVAGGDVEALTTLVQSGRNGGAWNGAGGIVTSTADALAGLTSLGVATAARTGYAGGTFRGISMSADDVLVMYTYGGDANLDGFISGDDYSAIDFASGVAGASGWANGDFNYDGFISGDDYSVIDFNLVAQGVPFATGPDSVAPVTAVPEPAATGMALVGALLVASRRRRGEA
jgi:hypothetical protein